MKKIIVGLGLAMALLLTASPVALAAEFITPSKDEGNVTVSSTETHRNLYTAGGNVLINGTTQGDLYIAGGNLTVEGSVEQDVVAAGGAIYLNGAIGGDVRVAGGNVTINGRVGGDVIVFAGSVHISDKSTVAGDVVANGGVLDIAAPVAGMLQVGGGKILINSAITGDVKVMSSDELTFGSKANMAGKISHRGPREAIVQDGAKVGMIDYQYQDARQRRPAKAVAAIFTIGFIIKLLASIAAALLLIKLFPRTSIRVLDRMGTHPWSNLGIGFLGLIVAPIAAIILLVLTVGFYIAIMAFFAYVFLLMLAGLVASTYVGAWVIKALTKREALVYDWQAIVIGVVIFAIAKMIPVIGWLALCIAMLMAFGVLLRTINDKIKAEQHHGSAE